MRFVDVPVGSKFSRWTTVSEKYKKVEEAYYSIDVVCECGVELTMRAYTLTSGRAERCRHCYSVERRPRLTPEQVVVNYALGESRRSARRRGLTFYLTVDNFKNLIFQNCYYCGASPKNFLKDRRRNPVTLPRWNGLDRINNDSGYDWNNVVTCCRWCNEAKKAKSTDEWDSWRQGLIKNYRSDYRAQARKMR